MEDSKQQERLIERIDFIMLNRIDIMGRLVRDPEMRQTGSGIPVATFTLAVDRDRKNESGEKETDFIDVVVWRHTAEFVSKYFIKGMLAVASGRLQIRSWEDKDGNKRRTAEVQADSVWFGESKRDNGMMPSPAAAPANFDVLDDDSELPF